MKFSWGHKLTVAESDDTRWNALLRRYDWTRDLYHDAYEGRLDQEDMRVFKERGAGDNYGRYCLERAIQTLTEAIVNFRPKELL